MGNSQPLYELQEILNNAEIAVPTGTIWSHYKNPESRYRVIGHTILEATNEVAVTYSPEQTRSVSFTRRLTVWLEEVNHNGSEVARFTRVE